MVATRWLSTASFKPKSRGRAMSTKPIFIWMEQLLKEHESKQFDHAYRLWSLLIFELWLRQWVDPAEAS